MAYCVVRDRNGAFSADLGAQSSQPPFFVSFLMLELCKYLCEKVKQVTYYSGFCKSFLPKFRRSLNDKSNFYYQPTLSPIVSIAISPGSRNTLSWDFDISWSRGTLEIQRLITLSFLLPFLISINSLTLLLGDLHCNFSYEPHWSSPRMRQRSFRSREY